MLLTRVIFLRQEYYDIIIYGIFVVTDEITVTLGTDGLKLMSILNMFLISYGRKPNV